MRRRILVTALAAFIAASCGDEPTQTIIPVQESALIGATINVTMGDGQVGAPNAVLPLSIRFTVTDAGGAPIARTRGTITVTSGGGSTNKAIFNTSPRGTSVFEWTLGSEGPQTVTIALRDGTATQTVNAVVIPEGSQIQIFGGDDQSAAPGDTLPMTVRVKVIDPLGEPIPNANVSWNVLTGGGAVRLATRKTNASGVALNFWALGWDSPVQTLQATVAGIGSVEFTATPVVDGLTFTVLSGDGQVGTEGAVLEKALVAVLRDSNNQPVAGGKGAWTVVSGDGTLNRTTFTTNSLGRAVASWTLGMAGVQTAKAEIGAVGAAVFSATFPGASACPEIPVGGTHEVTTDVLVDPSALVEFCLQGGTAGSEYVVIPVNLGPTPAGFSLTATNISAIVNPPSPRRSAMLSTLDNMLRTPKRDLTWEANFRKQAAAATSTRASSPAFRSSLQSRPSMNAIVAAPVVGDIMNLNVSLDACGTAVMRPSTVKAVGTSIIIVEDNTNPANGLTEADYAEIVAMYDGLIGPTVVNNFGQPTDVDANGRVIALYTNAVNSLSTPGSGSYVGGFFYSRDLLTPDICPTSNVHEMFYMLAADPTGVFGNAWDAAHIKSTTLATLAHEAQHLLNAGDRIYNYASFPGYEETWLDEGLSHIGEELVFHAATGFTPGANLGPMQLFATQATIDGFFNYSIENFGRYREWLRNPNAAGFVGGDNLATRGAAWAMLRYAADRSGTNQMALWNAMSGGQLSGLDNLILRLVPDRFGWSRDFAVAAYADDMLGASAAHSHPSWNFRDIYGSLDWGTGAAYPLATQNPTAGITETITVNPGGSAYFRMRVDPGTEATVSATTPWGPMRQVVVYRRN